ncbi:alkane 1-monooxygenase [Pelagimonas varians]|uniref:Alkane 1-monooxygenase 1 n=1 Tax=Pelagimonas varians TaxID=696760 RepID=A0A238KUF5_9RHOB|nr:alkane 1-monooxygenase [Pelagimonas varians]PYG28255.1 alkane 1-monooxygenase [Pelagimonas varians]SMX46328.1 Alkane 1-monooxygenase 1 [Pelagimonas varians]
MARFTVVTLGMVALLALALIVGAPFSVLALLYITVVTFFMDKLTALAAPDHPGAEFPAGNGLSVTLGVVHFPLLFGGVWAIGASDLAVLDKVFIFFALSLFLGQVSNSNAHELIHRSARPLHRLGVAVYSSILFGFHASAHVRVHHIYAATPRDPNSARLGQGFYRFAARAWIGALRQGYRAEATFRKGRGIHPYAIYGAYAACSLAIASVLAGWAGVGTLLGLSLYAQLQLLLSDYVQHYGLQRVKAAPNKWEPVGPKHSWNSPHGFSSALMLNAPRHSDHHAHPNRPYPGLELDRGDMPILPHPLPVMAVLALSPPLWRKVMDPRAKKWTS